MQFLWKYVDDLVGKGLEWYVIVKLLFYASLTFVPLALPLAILLSSLMTFGNFGENYELVAMKSAGISLKKVMMPLVILSFIISIFSFFFSNNVLPIANLKFRSTLYDIRSQKPAFNIKEGIFYNGLKGYTIRIGEKEKDGKNIHNIMIYDHTNNMGDTKMTTAKSGKMEVSHDKKNLIFTLYNGYNYDEKVDRRNHFNRPFQRIKFKEEHRRFDLSGFSLNKINENLFKNDYHMLNIKQLTKAEDSLTKQLNKRKENFSSSIDRYFVHHSQIDTNKSNIADTTKALKNNFLYNFNKQEKINIVNKAIKKSRNIKENIEFHKSLFKARESKIIKYKIEWHRKFTLSLACFILFFIGAPLGAIIRKGGIGLPLVISVLFFVVWHVTSFTAEKYVRTGAVDAFYGMWLSSVILLPIGIFLTYKATSDSPFLDIDKWDKFLKIFSKKKNI